MRAAACSCLSRERTASVSARSVSAPALPPDELGNALRDDIGRRELADDDLLLASPEALVKDDRRDGDDWDRSSIIARTKRTRVEIRLISYFERPVTVLPEETLAFDLCSVHLPVRAGNPRPRPELFSITCRL